MQYILCTSISKEDYKTWSKKQFETFFNNQTNDYFHIIPKMDSVTFASLRNRFNDLNVQQLYLVADQWEAVQGQLGSNDKKERLVDLLAGGHKGLVDEYKKIAEKRMSLLMSSFKTGDNQNSAQDLASFQMQIGIGRSIDLNVDLPRGIDDVIARFDRNKDILCFSDGRDVCTLHRDARGWKNVTYASKMMQYSGKKSLILHLYMKMIADKKLNWHPESEAVFVFRLLDGGKIYRIGYGEDSTLRLVEEISTQGEVAAACERRAFLYRIYYKMLR